MQPRITVLTLAVADLERAVAFYRDGLGFKTQSIVGQDVENGAVAFFKHVWEVVYNPGLASLG